MKYIDCELVFHLYSIDETLQHPGINEFDDRDVEFFGNIFNQYVDQCLSGVRKAEKRLRWVEEMSSPEEPSCSCNVLYRCDYLTVNISARIDCKPWPARNSERDKERRQWAANGELAQRWWIHHVSFPDGTQLDADGGISSQGKEEIRKVMEEYILARIK